MTALTVFIPSDTVACSLGANEIAVELARCFPDTKIVRTGSRGAAWLEPLLEYEVGNNRIGFRNVKVTDVKTLFKGDGAGHLDHKLSIGVVDKHPYFKAQTRLLYKKSGVIDPLSVEDYISLGGFSGLKRSYSMSPSEIIKQISASGLRGRGGAGFPTGIKWNTVLKARSTKKYVVCNADEGDSGTFADRVVMESDPFSLFEGMMIAGRAVGADKGFIYLRSEYPRTKVILETAISNAYAAGWLGKNIMGSGNSFDLEIRLGAGAYICGEETSMLESLEGKRGQVRPKPPLPAISGLFGMPTVINNVVSLCSVTYVLEHGADKFFEQGVHKSRGTSPWQLAGNIKFGGLVEAPFGITLRYLIEEIGGGTKSGRPIYAVQVGGPLGAYFPESLLDIVLDYESFILKGGMIGHGGVVVFDDTVNMAAQARFAMEFCSIESCGKCTPCRIGSIRGVEVIDKILANDEPEKNIMLLEDLCETMEATSLCAMGGLTPLPVRSSLKYFPETFIRNSS